jgi:HEAT repeat protein
MGEIGEKVGDENLSNEIASGLVQALGDPDQEVRKNAAAALGLIGHHDAVGGLFALFRAAGKVRA